jgi:hypothetical protein
MNFTKYAKTVKNIVWNKNKYAKIVSLIVMVILVGFLFMQFLYNPIFESYTGVTNAKLTYESSEKLSDSEFEALASELTYDYRKRNAEERVNEDNEFTGEIKKNILMNTKSFQDNHSFNHIEYFRRAGIRQYKGPETCLSCHETMKARQADGSYIEVNTLEDVMSTMHFKFQTMDEGFSTYGYDGRKVNDGAWKIPVGKIDRACGIPGSFSWTGWAALIESNPEDENGDTKKVMRSEGCGQCHIGGNYHPATEKMMPVGDVTASAKEGIDCLICHSQNYDMNYRFVIEDDNGTRWNQDRTMKAAMSVTNPTNDNCLNCHQHNMGGDAYAHNVAAQSLGFKNQRILHTGAKRGNPFSKQSDVHAAAGLKCTDCHVPEGHKIPRGNKGTDLVGNDLPGKEVACENCHTSAPHTANFKTRVILNGHVNRLACETCHITKLEDVNVVLRDWVHPEFEKHEGIHAPTDIYRSGKPGKGFTYLWFNGNGTFLANALGDNPNGLKLYNPFFNQMTRINDPEVIAEVRHIALELKKHYPDLDVEKYVESAINTLSQLTPEMLEKRKTEVEKNLRPLMQMGESKIYPFKLFNAYMYEDLTNRGPYGAMILPFDYNVYYETGKPKDAVKTAIQNPIVKRMYEAPFKYYMMDEFMKYFGVGEWKTEFPLQNGKLKNVEPRWMRQMGTLMVNHGITRDAFECVDCHQENGIMDFEALGYRPERVKDLENLPELEELMKSGYIKMSGKIQDEEKDVSELKD